MKKLNVPEGYQAVMPYLIVENATAFIEWAIKVLDATEKMRMHRDDGTTIAHAELVIGDSTIMLADATVELQPRPAGMFVYVHDTDRAYSLSITNGAKSMMEPADMPYGRTCGVEDPFGNVWWPTQAP